MSAAHESLMAALLRPSRFAGSSESIVSCRLHNARAANVSALISCQHPGLIKHVCLWEPGAALMGGTAGDINSSFCRLGFPVESSPQQIRRAPVAGDADGGDDVPHRYRTRISTCSESKTS